VQYQVAYTSGNSPRVTQCIKSLEIANSRHQTTLKRSRYHCAGNNAVRTMALFSLLVTLPFTATRLEIAQIASRQCRSGEPHRKSWRKPNLKAYSFTACISTISNQLPFEFMTPSGLSKYFQDYQPARVWKQPSLDTNTIRGSRHWISFCNYGHLKNFIDEINGIYITGKELTVLWEWLQGYLPAEVESRKEFYVVSRSVIINQKTTQRAGLHECEENIELPDWFRILYLLISDDVSSPVQYIRGAAEKG